MKTKIQIILFILLPAGFAQAVSDTVPSANLFRIKKSGKTTFELPKMNVLYMGLNNPVIINAPGYSNFSVKVSDGEIHRDKDAYMVSVSKPGAASISIFSKNGKLIDTRVFRVKRVPDPMATVGGVYEGGAISKEELLTAGALIPVLKDFYFDLAFQITGFKMSISGKKVEYQEYDSPNNLLTELMIAALKRAAPGTKIYFEYIKTTLMNSGDRSTRSLNPMEFTIR